jgi:hypothetical protein
MLVANGFGAVRDIFSQKGRHFSFSMETAEGIELTATFWAQEGLLDVPVESEVYYFAGYQSGKSSMVLHSFRQMCLPSNTPPAPTTASLVGTITKSEKETMSLEYDVYNPATKTKETVVVEVTVFGSHFDNRRPLLQVGKTIQVIGTLEESNVVSMDNFFLPKTGPVNKSPSPKKEQVSLWANRPPRKASPTNARLPNKADKLELMSESDIIDMTATGGPQTDDFQDIPVKVEKDVGSSVEAKKRRK